MDAVHQNVGESENNVKRSSLIARAGQGLDV
jgi:hypothetical protein